MILGGILIGIAAGALWMAWRAHRNHTEELDRIGPRHGLRRDPGESNASYSLRIRNRMMIRGFPRW